jgi:nitric oxide reductase large subunit
VVPLIVLGHEAWENWRLKERAPWMANLRWPLMCFTAVAFWNMLGAGVFGFMINPPISLYYIQGLNTTPCTPTPRCSGSTASWRWASRCWCCAMSGPTTR